jgi:hypothetical protein
VILLMHRFAAQKHVVFSLLAAAATAIGQYTIIPEVGTQSENAKGAAEVGKSAHSRKGVFIDEYKHEF